MVFRGGSKLDRSFEASARDTRAAGAALYARLLWVLFVMFVLLGGLGWYTENYTAITSALIGGVVTIGVKFLIPILRSFQKRLFAGKPTPIVEPAPEPSRAHQALNGEHIGTTKPADGSKGEKVRLQVSITGNKVSVTGAVDNIPVTGTGEVIADRLVMIEYANLKPAVLHFGVVILEIMPSSTDLVGCYAGFGPKSNEPICGKLTLKKSALQPIQASAVSAGT